MNNDKNSPTPEHNGERYVDKATQDVIHQHLKDPNHKITEEHIANVDTDMYKRPLDENDEILKEVDDQPSKAGSVWDIDQ